MLTMACKDLGMDCSWEGRAETEEELMGKAVKHGKEVHGYTDEQLHDPEMVEKVKKIIKEE